MESPKHLYRSTSNKVFGGVAGGLGEYFAVDPVIIRILFVILVFAGGASILIYPLLWIAIPAEPIKPFSFQQTADPNTGEPGSENNPLFTTPPPFAANDIKKNNGPLIAGSILVVIGLLFLMDKLLPNVSFGDLWPALLIIVGGVLIFTSMNKKTIENNDQPTDTNADNKSI
jgi:phage shock protein C